MERPGVVRRHARPRHGPVERPVDLHGRGVDLEGPHAAHEPRGQVRLRDEAAVQVRCHDVGHHGVPSGTPLPVARQHRRRAPGRHLDAGHLRRAAHLAAERLEATAQRLGEPAGTALRHGEPDRLAKHGHEHAHESRAGRVQRDVGVTGVARDQRPRCGAAESRTTELAGGGEQHADEVEPAHAAQAREGRRAVAQGRERRQQRLDHLVADAVPLRTQREPRVAVAGVRRVEAGGRDVTVAVEHRPAAVEAGVAEHGGRVAPAQAVVLEPERADGRRGVGQGVEGAEGVVHEIGVHVAVAAHGAAHLVLRLEHEHRPAAVGEVVGGHEPVGAGADDDGVVTPRPAHARTRRAAVPTLARMPRTVPPARPRRALPDSSGSSTLPGVAPTGRVPSMAARRKSGPTSTS